MKLQAPHYSNPLVDHGKKETTLFGHRCPGIFYNYDDRFPAAARDLGDERVRDSTLEKESAEWWQEWLCGAYQKDVVLKHVIAGVNVATWFYYLVFGTVDAETKTTSDALLPGKSTA